MRHAKANHPQRKAYKIAQRGHCTRTGDDVAGKQPSGKKEPQLSRSELECEKSRAAVQMSDTLKAVVTAIFSSCLQILMLALGQHLENKKLSHIWTMDSALPLRRYLAQFPSKEIDRKNLTAIITSIDIIPNQKLVDIILSMKLKSHLGYVYIYYTSSSTGFRSRKRNWSRPQRRLASKAMSNRPLSC